VLRDGCSIATLKASETNRSEVIAKMVGREISDLFPRRAAQVGDVVLDVEHLSVGDTLGRTRLHDVSFQLRAGEVLGIGGLMGAGRTELLMHLFGAWGHRKSGTVSLQGKTLPQADPVKALRSGLALVSEDRRRYGLVLEEPIGFNLSLSSLQEVTQHGLVNRSAEARRNREIYEALQVKATGLEAIVGRLSGGNQQKVVIGKALLTHPQVVMLDEPTRGIDVGAKIEIYELINRLTAEGKAVLLVSSELPELIGMSDRILMLNAGCIGGSFSRAEATQEKLMQAAVAASTELGIGAR
jgi:D-xylose transport system ATP-binding protein